MGRFALDAKAATLEDVQTALSGLAGVAMGFPGALEELAKLCRDCGMQRIQPPTQIPSARQWLWERRGDRSPNSPVFAVYRLPLRNPGQPPSEVIERLREELPGVEIGANGQALVFMAEDPGLGAKVRSAVERVCGLDWSEHFQSLANHS